MSYTGPRYTRHDLEALCPWCIADGTAARRFDATFTDIPELPTSLVVPADVIDTVLRRTPGFSGWQSERWLFHCDDAAAFLGRAGHDELVGHEHAIRMIGQPLRGIGWTDEQVEHYIGWLHVDGDATAYLFRCLHCGIDLAYSDES